jgi:predicted secreted hydrolase
MAAQPDPGFKRADRPREFDFPADHGAHPEYATEWWYFTGNLATQDGRPFGYQLTLFRVGLAAGMPAGDAPLRSTQMYMGHLAITDIREQRHHSQERFSRAAAGLAGARTVPLRVWLGSWAISGQATGPFPLRLRADAEDIEIDLTLQPGDKPRVLQGDAGWSQKSAAPGNASYYYSHTRLPTSGRLRVGDAWYQVSGNSWLDREWSSSALGPDQAGWDWFALHLQDGRDLMFYRMRGKQGEAQSFSQGVLVDQHGETLKLDLDNTRLSPNQHWQSDASGVRYPVGWRLQVPGKGIDLQIDARVADQEMNHSVRYWEGAVAVSGSHRGVGYLEMSGYQ